MGWLHRAFRALALAGLLLPIHLLAQVCAAPGVTGALAVSAANTLVNTYYPGTAAGGGAGATSLGYASASSRGAAVAIAAGDLVLIVQMQDGTGATTTNSAAYSFPATGAGTYEFARVASVGANVLNLASGLINSYAQDTSAAINQTYQVIRVPQYSTLTINSGASIVPSPWDGTTGGMVVADVSGAFTNNGSIDVSYAGFRGNAGLTLGGFAGAAAQTAVAFDRVQPDTYTAHGGKGEGSAGTPNRVLNVFSSPGTLLPLANGVTTNSTAAASTIAANAAFLNTTSRSYNGGSRAAGAPANAGGGGTDSAPASNSQNTGGGGGGNAGSGGMGGNAWSSNEATGGRGGLAATIVATKLRMGGGGGSGTTNNGYALDTSGGAGGGVIMIKAGTAGGTGSLLANGQGGRSVPVNGGNCPANGSANCDAGGGGGAGGGIVLLASSGSVASAQANGGQGGNINGIQHGPGGGGGGGYLLTSTGLAIAPTLTGGVAGLTNVGGTPTAYGAGAGIDGSSATVAAGALPPAAGGLPGACLPALSAVKATLTPAASNPISPPGTTTYSISVTNAAGRGDARGIVLYDPSLPGGSVTVAIPPTPTATFSVAPSACALAARTATSNPITGSTSTFTAGTFSLPGSCALTYTFSVNVPVNVPNGTYNNSAVAWFVDPSDSSGSRTVTAALPPAAAGLAANTAFTTGGAVGGSNYDGDNVANTGEDIRVQRSANLQVTKTDGLTSVVAGAQTVYTLTVSNGGPADSSGTVLRDPVAAGLTCTAVSCSSVTGAAVCPAAGSVTIANLQGASGITLDALPAGSSISFLVTCGVAATGQ